VDYKKLISIFQVVMLILSLVLSIYCCVLSSLAMALGRVQYAINLSTYYIGLSIFIFLGLLVKLIFRHNDLVLPIIGLMASIAFITFFLIKYKYANSFDMGIINFAYYTIIILLPISSILGFVVLKK
jgi:hypothetical protein